MSTLLSDSTGVRMCQTRVVHPWVSPCHNHFFCALLCMHETVSVALVVKGTCCIRIVFKFVWCRWYITMSWWHSHTVLTVITVLFDRTIMLKSILIFPCFLIGICKYLIFHWLIILVNNFAAFYSRKFALCCEHKENNILSVKSLYKWQTWTLNYHMYYD